MKKAIIVAFASAFLFACGGGEEEETSVDAGTTTTTDAGTTTTTDAGTPENCGVDSNLGAITEFALSEGLYKGTPATPDSVVGYFDVNEDPDTITILLIDGAGVFADGIKTGTFKLADDDLNYKTCGLCVTIDTNYFDEDSKFYMATGGEVKITEFNGRLTGTLSNVTFEHATYDENTYESTPVGDGCTSSITSAAFDTALVEDTGE